VVDLDLTLDLELSLSSSKDGSLLGPLLPLSRLWKVEKSGKIIYKKKSDVGFSQANCTEVRGYHFTP